MRHLVLCLVAVAMVWAAGCSDGGASIDGVTMMGSGASAVFGGCGDIATGPEPDGGYVPCGAPRDFSVEISLQNTSGAVKQVTIVAVTVLDEAGKELATATIRDTVVTGGAPFDGALAPGASVQLKIELDSFYLGFTGSSMDTIRYHVVLTIDGQQTSVDSPTTTYSGPPA